MSDTYTAITIGPIYDTISLTSSPAGIWAASYIFSYISRLLCEMIVDNELVEKEEYILSPYFSKKEMPEEDGIGYYHDRIIFKPKNSKTVLENLSNIFDKVASKIAEAFDDNPKGKSKDKPDEELVDWFKQYLQLHALNFESKDNPLLDCSQYLDSIELEKTFPTSGSNPLENLLDKKVTPDNPDYNKNIRDKIRENFCGGKWSFPDYKGDDSLPDMEDITGRRKEKERPRRKINSYFAIVQADGDKFGNYIKGCPERGQSYRDFSKICFDFCSASVKLVHEYGGVPIYAGGDDLLFIVPLTEKKHQDKDTVESGDRNILNLLVDLREKFSEKFWKKTGDPTLSFGVVIRYYKYPLYEAFAEVYEMLRKAKETRNAVAISSQKHSGHTAGFVLEEFIDTKAFKKPHMLEKLQLFIKKQLNDDMLQSIRSMLWEFEPLFRQALEIGSGTLKNVFYNTFDSTDHHTSRDDINLVHELLETLPATTTRDGEEIKIDRIKQMDSLLRFAKFWGEKGDDGDA